MRVVRLGEQNAATRRSLRLLHALGPDAMKRALGFLGTQMIAAWRKNIDSGRSVYHSFPALTARYASEKRRAVGDKPILVRTGAMYGSLTWDVQHPGAGRYVLLLQALGVGVDRGRTTANIDKVRWAIAGSFGGARKGHRPASFGESLGMRARTGVGKRANFRVPPRVFTALPRNFAHARIAESFLREVKRTGGKK